MSFLERLLPRPRLTANRIERSGQKRIERFAFDAKTASELGREQIGLLVCNCESLTTVVRCLRGLDVGADEPQWIVMTDGKERAKSIREIWLGEDVSRVLRGPPDASLRPGEGWRSPGVLHGTPETVTKLIAAMDPRPLIAALLLLDPRCHVHRARGLTDRDRVIPHDRPQILADLRTTLAVEDWSPPLFILTEKDTAGVEVETVQRSYYLEALQFLDGRTLLVRP